MMAVKQVPCRFCQHAVNEHGSIHGCDLCKCAASQSEARPRTDAELDEYVLGPGEYRHGWQALHDEYGYDAGRRVLIPGIPMTDDEWADAVVHSRVVNDTFRCNYYRKGYGTCCLLLGHSRGTHSYIRIPPNPTTGRQETDMTRSATMIAAELRTIEAEEQRLFERKVALQAEAERLEARPKEPTDGSVIRFKVQEETDGTVYSYAAIRAGDLWYITSSRKTGGYSWHHILDMIERDVSVQLGAAKPEFHVDSSWKRTSW